MSGYFGAPVSPIETNTEKGIRGISNALMICIIAAVLSTITSLATLVLVGQLTTTPTTGLLASALGVLALLCGVLALYLVVIILGIIGFSSAYKGRTEFGPEHEKDMGRAMIFFVVAIIFFFGGGILSIMTGVFVGLSGGSWFSESAVFLTISKLFSILFSATVALLLYFIVKAFTPPERQNLAIIAVSLYVLSSIIGYVLGLVYFPSQDFLDHPTTVPFDPLWVLPGILAGVLTIIALLLFLVLYRDANARLKSRQFMPGYQYPMAQTQFQDQQLRWQPPPSP